MCVCVYISSAPLLFLLTFYVSLKRVCRNTKCLHRLCYICATVNGSTVTIAFYFHCRRSFLFTSLTRGGCRPERKKSERDTLDRSERERINSNGERLYLSRLAPKKDSLWLCACVTRRVGGQYERKSEEKRIETRERESAGAAAARAKRFYRDTYAPRHRFLHLSSPLLRYHQPTPLSVSFFFWHSVVCRYVPPLEAGVV